MMDFPIKSQHETGSDIYRPLFDSQIHRGETFKNWKQGKDEPQLRVYGGPGSGKTTFVAIVQQHLQDQGATVLAVFIQPHAQRTSYTLSNIMQCILHQLSPAMGAYGHPPSYQEEELPSLREQIHGALLQLRTQTRPVFLLLDGCDSSDASFHQTLENELSALQKLGVKVLVTSRPICAATTLFFERHGCDFCERRDLDVYWECMQRHVACQYCYPRLNGECSLADHKWFCGHDENKPRMVHPYKYSFINLNRALQPSLLGYIRWNLESEHGDLGLPVTSLGKSQIPLSKLAFQLISQGGKAQQLVKDVMTDANDNVALARLRLDIIHGLNDLDLIEAQMKTPPPDVIALLDLAFGATQHESVPLEQRTLALIAMTVVSQFLSFRGVPFEILLTILQLHASEAQDKGNMSGKYTEDEVARSTKGLLVFNIGEARPLLAYNEALHTYLTEENQPAPVRRMAAKLGGILEKSGMSWGSLNKEEDKRFVFDDDVLF